MNDTENPDPTPQQPESAPPVGPSAADEAPLSPAGGHMIPAAAPAASAGYADGYAAPAQLAPAAPKKSRKGLWFGLGGGLAAIALVITGIVVMPKLLDPGMTADKTVTAFFEALADNDAKAAMLLMAEPADPTFLRDDVLERSNELAPIVLDEVAAPVEVAEGEFLVTTTYRVGDTEVTHDFPVTHTINQHGTERWRVGGTTFRISVPIAQALEPTVSGVRATKTAAVVFPGTYDIELSYPDFVIVDNAPVTVTHDNPGDWADSIRVDATEEAKQTFVTMVTDALNACLALKTLSTPCGLDLRSVNMEDDYAPVEGTVTRTLTDAGKTALAGITPVVVGSGWITAEVNLDITVTLSGTKNGVTEPFIQEPGLTTLNPTVVFTAATPELSWPPF